MSKHRPKTMHGGVRIGEASHPGPTCTVKHCNHDDCTTFGHHHRPKGKTGAARRAEEKKTKNGSSKPSRYKPCMLHLEAGKCGVNLPHGHCSCPTEHFHDLLTAHIAHETRHEPSPLPDSFWARTPAEYAAEERRLTEAFNSFDFVVGEHLQQLTPPEGAQAPDTPSTQVTSDFNFAAFTDEVPAQAEKKESFTDDDDTTSSESKHNDEPEEDDDAGSDDDTDSVSSQSDDEIEYIWSDWSSNSTVTSDNHFPVAPASPATRKLLVFTGAVVGSENIGMFDRIKNWLQLHLGPLTRISDTTLVNRPMDCLIDEHVTLLPTTTKNVNWFWKTANQSGWNLTATEGDVQLFRDLLPSCREATIYSKIYDDALLDPRLNKQEVITRDLQISRSLGPIVRDYVYSQAAELTGTKPNILLWTVVAIMNALTASGIVTRMSSNGQGLDFRTWGQYRHR